jgi:hypothetical protein
MVLLGANMISAGIIRLITLMTARERRALLGLL